MQSDIFRIVREKLDILDFIKSETTWTVKKVGEDTYRVNPCPWCDHHDCLTVYHRTQSFNCFSCDVAGDVIHIEKQLKSLDSNRAAAESLIQRFNLENRAPQASRGHSKVICGGSTSDTDVQKSCKSNPIPADADRHMEARMEAAMFWHQQLLQTKRALNYMTVKRKHSLNILKKLLIGYASGDIISHLKGKKFSDDELIDIGFAKREGSRLKSVVAEGLFVFPQWCNSQVVHFILKDPEKKRNYQLPKKCAADGWLCYGQDCLKEDGPVIIVEGPDDMLSIIDKAGEQNVICVHGNFNT